MKLKAILISALAIGCALFHSCSKHVEQAYYSEHPASTAALDSLFSSVFPAGGPGAIVGMTVNGDMVYRHGFGQANLATEALYTDSTTTNICAATRAFTTAAIMKLVQDGKLSLEQPISDFFPEFRSPIFSRVTIRHILSNSTGLPDTRPRNNEEWHTYIRHHESTFSVANDYMLYGRESEMIKYFESLDSIESEPGTKFRFQDPPFMLLARVISKSSGMRYTTYMTDSIFAPAGLTETFLFDPDSTIDNEAHGYAPYDASDDSDRFVSEDKKWEEYDFGEAPFFPTRADRGIYTTARDYFKWIKAFTGGKIISKDALAQIMTPQVYTKLPSISYGLGTFVHSKGDKIVKMFHLNYNGGFSVYQCYYPDDDVFLFIFSNRPDWDRFEMGRTVETILRKNGFVTK